MTASLRLPDGHMKTSAGDNLPIVNGMFAAGDPRAAENFALTSLQTLFVREHNYQVDKLHKRASELERRQAVRSCPRHRRRRNRQHHLLANFCRTSWASDAMSDYHGYKPWVDPHLTLEFVGAAFRFGHSIVSNETEEPCRERRSDRRRARTQGRVLCAACGVSRQRRRGRPVAPSRGGPVAGARRAHRRGPAQFSGRSAGSDGPCRDQYPARPRSRARHAEPDPRGARPRSLYQVRADHRRSGNAGRAESRLRQRQQCRAVDRRPVGERT